MDLLLATGNAHKTREFRDLLNNEFNVLDLTSFPKITLPAETGRTFAENAILKAVETSKSPELKPDHIRVIADDSGLEVDALGGAPGIFSARYAGDAATDVNNIDKLLRELKTTSADQWSARFRCVIALAHSGKILGTYEGTVEGKIVGSPRGNSGFGYDPVFQPSGFEQTFGEMRAELKNQISHRAKAVAALRGALQRGQFPRNTKN